MGGYTARDVAAMLGLPASQVRAYAHFLSPERGPRGEFRFTFQDLVLLKTAKELADSRVPPAKLRRALKKLKERLPEGRPLTAVRIVADGGGIAVHDGEAVWNPESGQELFDFAVADLASKATPVDRAAEAAEREAEETLRRAPREL